MKVLITGYPGTGKSSVARELQRRGHTAYDTEAMRGYMHLESVADGRRIELPNPIPRGWFDTTGSYNWDIVRVTKLLQSPEDIFICALADNQESLYEAFNKIFLLRLDEVELEKRLWLRITSDYGKDAQELADIMTLHGHFERSLLNHGAIAIDVRKSAHDAASEILSHVYHDS